MDNLDKILTKKQYEIYKMNLEGKSRSDISKILGCSYQNVYDILAASKRKIEKYEISVRNGFPENESHEKSGKNGKRGRKGSIFIEYSGIKKTLSEWCEEFDIKYYTAYARYRKGYSVQNIFEARVRETRKFDYTIKDEYDLTLISDEYRYILEQKNNGRSFKSLAEELGCTSANVCSKAKIAISQLNCEENEYSQKSRLIHEKRKNDKEYIEHKREKSREWYQKHLEEERRRNRERYLNGGKINNYQRNVLSNLKTIESLLKDNDIEKAKNRLANFIENVEADIRKKI